MHANGLEPSRGSHTYSTRPTWSPLAFDLAAAGHTTERDARTGFRDLITDGKLMTTVVRDITSLLIDNTDQPSDNDSNEPASSSETPAPVYANASGSYSATASETAK